MKDRKLIIAPVAILLVIVLFLLSFRLYAFSEGFYRQEFSRLDVYSNVENADAIGLEVRNYIRDGAGSLDSFSVSERSHLWDVKRLADLLEGILWISAAAALILMMFCSRTELRRAFIAAGLSGIALSVTFALAALFVFPWLFSAFHEAFFTAGSWVFSPSDLIIRLFPWQFFRDALLASLLTFLSASGFIAALAAAIDVK